MRALPVLAEGPAGKPLLARIAYSGLIARLAVLGAALSVLGLSLILGEVAGRWSA